MDAFQQFDNTAGFFVGNEVLTTPDGSAAAPYVKAAAQDMKAYRDMKGYRQIPIGYSAADIASLRPNLQNYLACGSNQNASIDFFALNAYEWCGQNTYMGSGYNQLNQMAQGYNIPIFFSETGCNTLTRDFGDQAAILGPDMDDTWSGAMIYEWIEEANNYGLISYGPTAAATATGTNVVGGFTVAGTPTPIQPDWNNLSSQWATLNPTGTSENAYTPSNSPPACPSYTSGTWNVSPNAPLPTLGAAAYNGQAGSSSGPSSGASSTTGGSSSRSGSSGSSATGTASGSRSGAAVAAASGTSAGGASSTSSGSASTASATKAGASADRQIAGMAAGLVGVMLGFVWWL